MSHSERLRGRLSREQIFTIPNAMSGARLLLIPLFLWLYCVKRADGAALCVIALSGLTDCLDGWVARRFQMVSDFGKLLDPVADKLTQAAMLGCLCVRHRQVSVLLILFAGKELWMLCLGLRMLRRTDTVKSACWHGKLNTALLEVSAAALLVLPGISERSVTAVTALCAASLLLSASLYTREDLRRLRQREGQTGAAS